MITPQASEFMLLTTHAGTSPLVAPAEAKPSAGMPPLDLAQQTAAPATAASAGSDWVSFDAGAQEVWVLTLTMVLNVCFAFRSLTLAIVRSVAMT